MAATLIRQRLDSILAYMQPHWEFVNCHMVNYLTDNYWQRFVPQQLRTEVCDGAHQVQSCIEMMFWRCNCEVFDGQKFSAFTEFLKESQRYRLQNFSDILTTMDELKVKLGDLQHDANTRISIKEFMSEKKRHEVEITAELVDELIKCLHSKNHDADVFVIDAGDGKGYLSSRLALQYKHKVLGIDFNETNTVNALERSKKMQRAWSSLTDRALLENVGITPPRRGKGPKKRNDNDRNENGTKLLENYKTTSKFITTDLDFVQLVREHFGSTISDTNNNLMFCLTGLHTCGNLAPTCLKVFNSKPQFKVLCNIGCCYHLLKEEFSDQEFFGNKYIMDLQCEPGFPMSSYLREKQFSLGRNARMLAAQSIERTVVAKELPNISLFYRALLELLICEKDMNLKNTVQVGRLRKFSNFNEYVNICNIKAGLQLENVSSDRIAQLEIQHEADKKYLDLFYLLRMSFAPILESIILLDRLLYLHELNYKQSFVIPLFDSVISPRHFCIVAVKS